MAAVNMSVKFGITDRKANIQSSSDPAAADHSGRLSVIEAERIISILDDTAEKLNFLDRSVFLRWIYFLFY